MTTIFSIVYFLVFIIIAGFLFFLIGILLFRRGKSYLYIRDLNHNKTGELFIAQVKSITGSKNYKIIDASRGSNDSFVGEVQVTAGKAVVRLRQTATNQDEYLLTDVGEVDQEGCIYRYENGQANKIGHCDPNGKRKIRDLWLLLHTEVDIEGLNEEIIGCCTESLRFRKRKPDEITLLARAAAILLLYKPVLSSADEERHPATIPFGHLAFPAAIIYLVGFAFFSSLFNLHDLFPLIGHIISYVAAMLLIYFVIIWLLKLLTTDMQMRGISFGTWLTLINRNTGLRSWNLLLILFLFTALVLSIFIRGYQLLPLWMALLIGVGLNMLTFISAPWTIFLPIQDYLNIQFAQGTRAAAFNPYAQLLPDDLTDKQYAWKFDSLLKGKEIKADKTLTFSNKYIDDKRKENPFAKDNSVAIQDLYKSAKDVIRSSPDQIGDWLIQQILTKVSDVARTENLSQYDTMQLILSFCQNPNFQWIMDYDCDEIGKAQDYFRFPIETIFDKRGDCDCTALMCFMLFKKAGIPSAYLLMVGEGGSKHAAVAIGNVPEDEAITLNGIITIRGKKFYFCETIGDDWKVGVLPDSYAERLHLFEQELVSDPNKAIVSEDF